MSAHCCSHEPTPSQATSPRYRRVLWIALALNAVMFALELGAGVRADSAALMADAADFFGDSVNYGLSLGALALAAVWRSRVAAFKGATMLVYGFGVLGLAAWNAWHGATPQPLTMGLVGTLALIVNAGVAALLYTWRDGDANMRSVWLCSRNDAIGNVAVLLAAIGVFGTGTLWPDLIVATLMAALGVSGGITVWRAAQSELAAAPSRRPGLKVRVEEAGHDHPDRNSTIPNH
ncbi:MAG: cation transporter [Burkholderiaceae bacterium]